MDQSKMMSGSLEISKKEISLQSPIFKNSDHNEKD
jgi:hypothetical protein